MTEVRLSGAGAPGNSHCAPTAAAEAVGAYDPEKEAVVIDERTEGIVVVIVGRTESQVVGEFF